MICTIDLIQFLILKPIGVSKWILLPITFTIHFTKMYFFVNKSFTLTDLFDTMYLIIHR